MKKVAIIGGGISGITSAVKLAENSNNKIHVFEKRDCILKGPPYCHLHAGGILYPEISIEDAKQLMNDSLVFANKFKKCLNYRPTVVAYNIYSNYTPSDLLKKCQALQQHYIHQKQYILCEPSIFYAVYTLEDMLYYKKHNKLKESVDEARQYHDKYVINFLNMLGHINDIKYPFISICEPGINQQNVEEQLIHEVKTFKNITIHTNKEVCISDLSNEYDVIINASGRNICEETEEKYEFKSSWLISLPLKFVHFPEIAIIGERETYNGMVQITPINTYTFQVHCMTRESTIIKTFNNYPIKKLGLTDEETYHRGSEAIKMIGKYLPIFMMSNVEGACAGVQRIPYNSKNKRVSMIQSYIKNKVLYIDMLTLKACSTIGLSEQISLII